MNSPDSSGCIVDSGNSSNSTSSSCRMGSSDSGQFSDRPWLDHRLRRGFNSLPELSSAAQNGEIPGAHCQLSESEYQGTGNVEEEQLKIPVMQSPPNSLSNGAAAVEDDHFSADVADKKRSSWDDLLNMDSESSFDTNYDATETISDDDSAEKWHSNSHDHGADSGVSEDELGHGFKMFSNYESTGNAGFNKTQDLGEISHASASLDSSELLEDHCQDSSVFKAFDEQCSNKDQGQDENKFEAFGKTFDSTQTQNNSDSQFLLRRLHSRHSVSEDEPGKLRKKDCRKFPPPLPFLANSCNAPCQIPWVQLRSFKSGGRLVIQEVKVRHHEFFRAERYNGRLTLHLVRHDDEVTCQCSAHEPDNRKSHENVTLDASRANNLQSSEEEEQNCHEHLETEYSNNDQSDEKVEEEVTEEHESQDEFLEAENSYKAGGLEEEEEEEDVEYHCCRNDVDNLENLSTVGSSHGRITGDAAEHAPVNNHKNINVAGSPALHNIPKLLCDISTSPSVEQQQSGTNASQSTSPIGLVDNTVGCCSPKTTSLFGMQIPTMRAVLS